MQTLLFSAIALLFLILLILHIKNIMVLKLLNALLTLKSNLYQDILGNPKLNNVRDYLINYTDQQIVFFTHRKINIFSLFYGKLKQLVFRIVFSDRLSVAEEDIRNLHFANISNLAQTNQFSPHIHQKIHALSKLSVYSYGYLFARKD